MARDENSVTRLLDAAANRVGEAARVIEDYARFVLGDRHLTEVCKQLRHDLADVLATLGRSALCASRDTTGDVGCQATTAAEMLRADPQQVCTASFKRLEQSLRSLEEYSKLDHSELAARFEQLRYRTYTLEKAACATADGCRRLARVRLCVLIDGRDCDDEFEQLVAALVAADVDMIQLRDKSLGDRAFLDRARIARRLATTSDTLLVINDRADVAALVRADGLHVGENDLRVSEARAIVGPEMLIGVSTSDLQMARQAALDGAHYIGIGPVFPTTTKQFDASIGDPFIGTGRTLEQVAAALSLPVFAIGGIDATNIDHVLATGIHRVAVSQAVIGQADPAAAARKLADRLPNQ